MNKANINKYKKIFEDLPEQNDNNYGIKCREIITNICLISENKIDEEIYLKLFEIIDCTKISDEIRFSAFYTVQVALRRCKHYDRHKQNIKKYSPIFRSQPMFKFMKAELLGDVATNNSLRNGSIKYARDAASDLPDVAGVQHLLAEYLVEYIEFDVSNQVNETEKNDLLFEALESVNLAITINDKYAKYYSTRARINVELNNFPAALEDINKGRMLETDLIRSAEYTLLARELRTKHLSNTMNKTINQSSQEFRNIKSEVLNMMGLLAAIIALISTSANILNNLTSKQIITAQLSVSGSILLIFWAFSFLWVQNNKNRLPVLLVSIILFIVSAAFHFLVK